MSVGSLHQKCALVVSLANTGLALIGNFVVFYGLRLAHYMHEKKKKKWQSVTSEMHRLMKCYFV